MVTSLLSLILAHLPKETNPAPTSPQLTIIQSFSFLGFPILDVLSSKQLIVGFHWWLWRVNASKTNKQTNKQSCCRARRLNSKQVSTPFGEASHAGVFSGVVFPLKTPAWKATFGGKCVPLCAMYTEQVYGKHVLSFFLEKSGTFIRRHDFSFVNDFISIELP